jgi:hypothetical protein
MERQTRVQVCRASTDALVNAGQQAVGLSGASAQGDCELVEYLYSVR